MSRHLASISLVVLRGLVLVVAVRSRKREVAAILAGLEIAPMKKGDGDLSGQGARPPM